MVIPRMAAKVGSNGKLGSRGADKDEWRKVPFFMFRMGKNHNFKPSFATASGGFRV